MKILLLVAVLLLGVVGVIVFTFTRRESHAPVTQSSNTVSAPANVDAQLSELLNKLCATSGGKVSVAVLHVETGKLALVDGSNELPLFSVFKLPLAITVLKKIEEGSLKLDQTVHVVPGDVIKGSRGNTQRWQKPVDLTIKELLELSIVESDNTSSDKLLQLVGGPSVVTERMRSFGLQQINIRTTIREYVATDTGSAGNPASHAINTGSALDLANLLSRLQRSELLESSQTELLIGMMERTKIGLHRLRGNLPPGTKVADKTGSGDPNPKTHVASSTNDVGLITLPNNRGHLAIAVLLRDSTLADDQQEKLIADLARAAFDAYSTMH